jgi:hypothetical protein
MIALNHCYGSYTPNLHAFHFSSQQQVLDGIAASRGLFVTVGDRAFHMYCVVASFTHLRKGMERRTTTAGADNR